MAAVRYLNYKHLSPHGVPVVGYARYLYSCGKLFDIFFFCERFLVQWVLIAANQTFQQPTVNALFTWRCTILGRAGILFCLLIPLEAMVLYCL